MTALLLALLLGVSAPSDSVTERAPAPVAEAVDSEQLAKLAAVQSAWDGDSASRRADAPARRSVGSTLAQIGASLALLLGLAVAGLLLVRRSRRRGGGSRQRQGALLDVLESRSLGQGNSISLVRVHDRVVAVGHGPGGVSPLAEFLGADAAGILAESGDGAVSVRDFTATLDSFLERFRSAPQGTSGRNGEEP